jgi:hypothetical protein
MAELFITVLNGVITGKHHGDINAELFGTPYYGHKKIAIPFEAGVIPMEPIEFYTPDWTRKPDCCLIDEGLMLMPKGYVREGDELRPMKSEERIIAGLDNPQIGYKVADGKIVPMTLEEQLAAEQITQETYEEYASVKNTGELQLRIAELQTPEVLARMEIDAEYAAERKEKLKALLAVKTQSKWPIEVVWP